MSTEFLLFLAVGVGAQLVDGALGMGYGVISTTVLLAFGATPANASAAVHAAKVFTGAASAASHVAHRNVDKRLFWLLSIGAVLGGVPGAYLLTSIDGKVVKPFVIAWLALMGILILYRAFKGRRPQPFSWKSPLPLGFVGGLFDAIGGGGWGPIVTSTLLGSGADPRRAVGTTNTAELVLAVAVSAAFLGALVTGHWRGTELAQHLQAVAGLVIGGLIAAPVAGWLAKIVPVRAMMWAVGFLVLFLAGCQLVLTPAEVSPPQGITTLERVPRRQIVTPATLGNLNLIVESDNLLNKQGESALAQGDQPAGDPSDTSGWAVQPGWKGVSGDERMALAMSAARAGAFEVDFRKRAFWCSDEFITIWGCRPERRNKAGAGWEGMHPDDRVRFDAMRTHWTKPGFEHVDVRTVAHGDERWVRIYFEIRGRTAEDPGVGVGLVQDIDHMKRQELELIAARAAAEQATRAKSDFLASVSHEIRTPMNGIVGVLHLLKSEALSDEGRRMLDEALACSAMLGQLINDVLDLSKIEAGKLELSYEPTDPAAAVKSLLQLLMGQAQAKDIYLRAEVDETIGWVQADPVRFRQCLFNLIGNAVKFTSQGGVSVRLARVGPERLRLEVTDTGVGLSEEVRSRLFQRFEQADHTTTRNHGGTGLGLAITKSLVEMMGGDIGVDSAPGQGSTFWFEIDAKPCAAATGPSEADAEGCDLSGLRILLVDDNPTNRMVGGKILESLEAVALTVPDGPAAVDAARVGGFDLILMDINMPGMDGMEATRLIRALPGEAAQTPIIALTANVMAEQRQTYLASGMNGVIAKPFSPASLLTEIARLLSEADEAAAA